MKVLFLGSERNDAKAVATALRGIDDAITVSWAAHLQHGVTWLNDNRDVAALVVDARIDEGTWPSFVRHVRSLALRPAVAVIVPDEPFASIPPDADVCIRRNQFLVRDLPVVVTRALAHVARMALEQKLAAADKQLAEQQAKYEIGMARAEANWGMVDEQLRAAALQVERARQSEISAAADVTRLSQRESELVARLADAAAAHNALETQLDEERIAAATAQTERQREFEARIAQALDERRGVEELLAQAVAAREKAERLHAAAMGDVARLTAREAELNDLLTERQREFDGRVAQALDERRGVEELLAQAVSARDQAGQRHAAAMDDVARLTAREAELHDRLAETTASRSDLEGRLTATEAAFEDAVARATRERLAASRKAAEREAELGVQIERERTTRSTLERTVADVNVALEQARRDQQAASAELDQLRGREAELDAQIHRERTTRTTLERTVADVNAALDRTRRDHQAASDDLERLRLRDADLESQLTDVQATRAALEGELSDATNALRCATARETELAEQVQHERAGRASLERTIDETNAALCQVRTQHQSAVADVERLTAREADLASQLEDLQVTRDTLEQSIADAGTALRDAQHHHEAALAAAEATRGELERQLADATSAVRDAAAREAELAAQLQQAHATQTTLEARIADIEVALDVMQQDYESAAADVYRLKQREGDLTSQLAEAHATRITLDRQLTDASAAIHEAQQRHEAALAAAETVRGALEQDYRSAAADVERLTQREGDLASQLAEAHTTRITLDHQLTDATAALRDVEAREAALDDQLGQERTMRAGLEEAIADAQASRSTLEQTLNETRARFVEQRQQLEIQLAQEQLEHESRTAELEERNRALTLERETLQQSLTTLQDRSRQMQESLTASIDAFELSRAESHRLFDQAGLAMFRCTREGELLDANRACATLIGRRTLDELEGVDFAATVFEAPQALVWVIERCVTTRTRESIETTWRRQDGSRLFMRLSARSLPSDVIEVVAEDLTRLRVLEERLGQAHRMEAVGRLASEVAITCTSLLGSIQDQGREWLLTSSGDAVSRQRGERLLDEIGRAAGFLRELAASGDEQARTPMLVDLNTLVRDLEPVLKNVVGGDVEVCLRDTSAPLNVDVGTERIERLLVNVASYSRGRMPAGARLRIELGTSVVDRHFSAKHPNVRLGLHALITVTESRRDGREDAVPSRTQKPKSHRPGVDFATLQGLVSDCGGHLWMKVHPLGEMLARIHLPLVSPQDQRIPRALAARGGRRTTAR
jgi:PAS domain S-box-containing protein